MTVNGPKGELSERISRDMTVEQDGDTITVTRPTDRGEHRSLHGLTRTLIANMVQGVTDGFEKSSRSRASAIAPRCAAATSSSRSATRTRSRSRRRTGSSSRCPQPTRITVRGASKQQVGEIAAIIRKQRKPEPYKGKGIRYEGEYVARKVGKRA